MALTHGHDDHVGDTVAICKANGATLIAVFEICAHLGKKGVEKTDRPTRAVRFTPRISTSPSYRPSTPRLPEGVYLGNPSGLVIKCKQEKHTLYHMGDTAIFSDMGLIHKLHKPDIGIVPVGDRFTMNPETAAFACRSFFKFKTVIPCHYATFPGFLLPDASRFLKALGPLKKSARAMGIGESMQL